MRTTFRTCVLVNFAVDPQALQRKLPPHLKPDLHEGKAYLSIVIARMIKMRPDFLPRVFGLTYNQIVYRAVVRRGAERGVTFLRSDADNALMVAAGNAFTFFRFHRSQIDWAENDDEVRIRTRPLDGAKASIEASYNRRTPLAVLPPTSRFRTITEAQAFLSELYVAFGAMRPNERCETVRIERTTWDSAVVADSDGVYDAMTSGLLFDRETASLDSIFLVRNLEYHWRGLSLEAVEETS